MVLSAQEEKARLRARSSETSSTLENGNSKGNANPQTVPLSGTDDIAILPTTTASPNSGGTTTPVHGSDSNQYTPEKERDLALYTPDEKGLHRPRSRANPNANADTAYAGLDEEGQPIRTPGSDGDGESEERIATRAIPRRYRLLAFSMIIFFNTSSSFSESTLSPLKGVFRDQLGVTSELSFPLRKLRNRYRLEHHAV